MPGMFIASLISAVLGNVLPGAGTLYRSQSLVFHVRAYVGDELSSRVTITDKNDAKGTVTTATEVTRLRDGARILSGTAEVEAPRRKITYDSSDLPGLIVQRHRHFERLIALAEPLAPLVTAVVCPRLSGSARIRAPCSVARAAACGSPVTTSTPSRPAERE